MKTTNEDRKNLRKWCQALKDSGTWGRYDLGTTQTLILQMVPDLLDDIEELQEAIERLMK